MEYLDALVGQIHILLEPKWGSDPLAYGDQDRTDRPIGVFLIDASSNIAILPLVSPMYVLSLIARFARINATLPSGLSASRPPDNVAKHWTSAGAPMKSAYRTKFCPPWPYYLAENDAAPDAMSSGYIPCYLANSAGRTFVSRDEKDELQMTWHIMWQKQLRENHLKAPLKPIVGINYDRKRPRILTNDTEHRLGYVEYHLYVKDSQKRVEIM